MLLLKNRLRSGQFLGLVYLFLSLVDQHVCVLDLLFRVIAACLAPVGLLSNIVEVEVPDDGVVELEPLFAVSVLDEGIVVPTVGIAQMNDDALQHIVEIVVRHLLLFFSILGALLFPQVLPGILL